MLSFNKVFLLDINLDLNRTEYTNKKYKTQTKILDWIELI